MELEKVLAKELIQEIDDTVTIGIDIGSRMGKAVLLKGGQLYTALTGTSVIMQETADYLIKKLLKDSNTSLNEVAYIVGTGYGRIAMQFEKIPSDILTEISCHGMGAHYIHAATESIVDIGGQDSKAIRIDPENGKVIDFVMNDKCAAGTGRFLEKVGEILGLKLEESGELALTSKKKIDVSSQCVVFAESEVITLRAKGEKREDILAGVYLAAARRVRNLVNRIGLKPDLIFSGGVSNNPGMRKALEEAMDFKFADISFNMSFNGALGAAIYAQHYYRGIKNS